MSACYTFWQTLSAPNRLSEKADKIWRVGGKVGLFKANVENVFPKCTSVNESKHVLRFSVEKTFFQIIFALFCQYYEIRWLKDFWIGINETSWHFGDSFRLKGAWITKLFLPETTQQTNQIHYKRMCCFFSIFLWKDLHIHPCTKPFCVLCCMTASRMWQFRPDCFYIVSAWGESATHTVCTHYSELILIQEVNFSYNVACQVHVKMILAIKKLMSHSVFNIIFLSWWRT